MKPILSDRAYFKGGVERVIVVLTPSKQFPAISCREQVTFDEMIMMSSLY